MVVLPAWFGNCTTCGRLIAVGGCNIMGACTKECGGSVREPEPAQERPVWFDALAVAHVCPSVESGDPDDCGFGSEGCTSARQPRETLEGWSFG